MKRRLIGITLVMTAALMLIGTMGASATSARGTLHAVVVKQQCVATGGMMVTLSVVTPAARAGAGAITKPIRYSWDYTTDGIFESPWNADPTVSFVYRWTPSALNGPTPWITATVRATGGSARSGARGSVIIPFVCQP